MAPISPKLPAPITQARALIRRPPGQQHSFRRVGAFLIGFGLVMPLLGAAAGLAVGHWLLGFGVGGTLLVAVLGASASYIAVPPAMRLANPEANPSFYLTLSLGVTFPFNVVIGIPLYYSAAQWLAK